MEGKALRTVYLNLKQIDELDEISKRTKIPKSVIIREGIDIIIEKYRTNELEHYKYPINI